MNGVQFLIGVVLVIVLLGGLWGATKNIKECEIDQDCTPTNPLVGVTYFCENGVCKTNPLGNPASEYCVQKGGKIEIITNPDGSQHGICKFSDGSECDEWAYYRGECQPGMNYSVTTTTAPVHHGTSSYGRCSSDSDCIISGCNGEICQSRFEEPMMSICVYNPPYPKDLGYECKCINQKCAWMK
jgi:eight-cysteine-cluster-containing protein